ncbi:MAG: FAD:protein FMN transferase [Dissulfurispiraceae bacterium]|jgi:thiamine biosynthesis lipoprotein|nr:FAD:protein FMN transferase [Dissulfurispiraceae bacterium]
MDTLITLTLVTDSEELAEAASSAAFKEIDRLHLLWDFFTDTSELSRLNKSSGLKPMKVSDDTINLIEKALLVSHKSKGAFDITTGPINELWDFHKMIVPSEAAVKEHLGLVNYRLIEIDKDKSTVFLKKKGMKIDLGGIAKGYAAARLTKIIIDSGIKSGIVAVGGDIRTFGMRPQNKLWRIGIKNPRLDENTSEIMAAVSLTDRSISTSGDYERFFIVGSRRYHHIIDPRTGYPSEKTISATVINDDSTTADALATAVFILGPEKGIELLNSFSSEGVIMDIAGKIHTTDGIKDKIEYIYR